MSFPIKFYSVDSQELSSEFQTIQDLAPFDSEYIPPVLSDNIDGDDIYTATLRFDNPDSAWEEADNFYEEIFPELSEVIVSEPDKWEEEYAQFAEITFTYTDSE